MFSTALSALFRWLAARCAPLARTCLRHTQAAEDRPSEHALRHARDEITQLKSELEQARAEANHLAAYAREAGLPREQATSPAPTPYLEWLRILKNTSLTEEDLAKEDYQRFYPARNEDLNYAEHTLLTREKAVGLKRNRVVRCHIPGLRRVSNGEVLIKAQVVISE